MTKFFLYWASIFALLAYSCSPNTPPEPAQAATFSETAPVRLDTFPNRPADFPTDCWVAASDFGLEQGQLLFAGGREKAKIKIGGQNITLAAVEYEAVSDVLRRSYAADGLRVFLDIKTQTVLAEHGKMFGGELLVEKLGSSVRYQVRGRLL